jgi:hypothetical protein
VLKQRAVGIFPNYQATEVSLRELQERGYVMDRVSVIGRDIDRHPDTLAGANTSTKIQDVGRMHAHDEEHDNEAAETAKKGAVAGGTVGGLTGLLVGIGALAIPGVGPVMLAGAAATALATAVSGGAIGAAAGSLAGGLVGLNIPEDRAQAYSDRVTNGDYLVMVEGSETDIQLAESIFNKHGIHDWYAYDIGVESHDRTATPVETKYLEH